MVNPNPQPDKLDRLNVIDGVFRCLTMQGNGTQADVWFACHDNGGEFAVKVFKELPILVAEKALNTEVEQYLALGEHPNIVRMIDHHLNGIQRFEAPHFERNVPYLVLEHITGGALW
jgi:hypothetical protein